MSDSGIGMIIEGLVAVLLALTMGYCVLINRRLKLLKTDEEALRATIAEMITATEIAEHATADLKITARECEINVGEYLNRADHLCGDLDRKLAAGADILTALSEVVPADAPHPAADQTRAIAAAAQAFAERLRSKVFGLAA